MVNKLQLGFLKHLQPHLFILERTMLNMTKSLIEKCMVANLRPAICFRQIIIPIGNNAIPT